MGQREIVQEVRDYYIGEMRDAVMSVEKLHNREFKHLMVNLCLLIFLCVIAYPVRDDVFIRWFMGLNAVLMVPLVWYYYKHEFYLRHMKKRLAYYEKATQESVDNMPKV